MQLSRLRGTIKYPPELLGYRSAIHIQHFIGGLEIADAWSGAEERHQGCTDVEEDTQSSSLLASAFNPQFRLFEGSLFNAEFLDVIAEYSA